MAPSLYSYLWKHTKRQQLWMLVIVIVSVVPLYLSLNLPKLIINGPIQGSGFENGSTDTYFRWSLPDFLPSFGGADVYSGLELERLEALYILSALFLGLVIVNGAFKYYLNIYKGRLGERMLRRLRFEMVDRVLRFPMRRLRRVRPAEIASMVKDELEPIGGFIGDAVIQPIYLMSQILTAMVFIFVQSFTLGLVALAVMGLQVVVIPRMRRRLLILGRQRQLAARRLAGSVGEIVEGMPAIRTNDVSNFVRARISDELGHIFLIRFDIYQWKFFVKFLNNFLSQATPFIFYLFGGYFAITGQMDIGALVATIAAYRELPSPLKDLIDWDLTRLDVNVKYEQVMDQFYVDGLLNPRSQAQVDGEVPHLTGPLRLESVTIRDETGISLATAIDLALPLTQQVAATGPVGDGAESVAEALALLSQPSEGAVTDGGRALADLPERITGRRIAFVDTTTYFPQSSLRAALFYPLMHRLEDKLPPAVSRREQLARAESIASGNSVETPEGDWVDHTAIGASHEERLAAIREVLDITQLTRDIKRIGLGSTVPDALVSAAEGPILRARADFSARLQERGLAKAVQLFTPDAFLSDATIIENIVFGAMRGEESMAVQLIALSEVRDIILSTGLDAPLAEMGRKMAETLVEVFGGMGEGNPLFRRMSIGSAEEIEALRALLARIEGRPTGAAELDDRRQLIRLALGYAEPRYRLGLLDAGLKQRIIEARRALHAGASETLLAEVDLYEPGEFNPSATIRDNIVFGRVGEVTSATSDALDEILVDVINGNGLSDIVLEAALDFDIGSGAKRLTVSQQQRLALARAILKAPDYLVANRCLSSLDGNLQQKIVQATLARGRDAKRPFGVFWVVGNLAVTSQFQRLISFKGGRVVEDKALAEDAALGQSPVEALRGEPRQARGATP